MLKKRKVVARPMKDAGTTFTVPEISTLYFRQRPALACKYLLNFELTWYQARTIRNILRVPYSLLSWGRGCLDENTPVFMADNTWKPIKDINIGDKVYSVDSNNNLHVTNVVRKLDNGREEVFRITLVNGLIIDVTSNHPLLSANYRNKKETKKSFKSLDDRLSIGDRVGVSIYSYNYGNLNDPDLAKFIGYIISDGSVNHNQSPKFTNNNKDYISEVDKFCKERWNLDPKLYPKCNGWDLILSDGNKGTKNPINEWFRNIDLFGKKEHRENFPDIVYEMNKESFSLFINRMFASCGWCTYWDKKRNNNDFGIEIGYSSCNESFANNLKLLLLRFGIYSKIFTTFNKDSNHYQYNLRIYDKNSIKLFLNTFGLIYGKESNCKKVLDIIDKKSNKGSHPPAFNNIKWFKIKSVESLGFKQTYDITVDKYHNFIANGCIVSNSGKTRTVATAAILTAMFYPNTKVGVFGPVKRQSDYIFMEIQNIYRNSPFIQASTTGQVKMTMERNSLEFVNGSTIISMPVGDGNKIRGARFNVMFLDEYAQFDPAIIDLVIRPFLAIQIGDRPNKLIMSSSAYYRWNHLWTQYKNYRVNQVLHPDLYYVSEYDFRDILIDPNPPFKFDLNIIKQAKESMTDAEYRMEWLGEYPDDLDTFITTKLIDKCTPKPPNDIVDIEFDCYIENSQGTRTGRKKDSYVMGIDVGRAEGGANFAISICKYFKQTNTKHLVRMISRNGVRYQEMERLIRECCVDYNIERIHCDKGGGGETIRDLLREPWIDSRDGMEHPPILDLEDDTTLNVTGLRYLKLVNFHGTKHSTLFTNLKSEMEHDRMFFPFHIRRHKDQEVERANLEIKAVKDELSVIKPKPTGASLKFESPTGFRKDRAVALTLALDAAMELHEPNWSPLGIEQLAVGYWI